MGLYQISVYIPATHLEQVKQAMFDQGAGRIGAYDCCSWQVLGQGQFRPLANSQPFLGIQNQVETVSEYRVDMVCSAEVIANVIDALKNAHPYEQPAYMVWPLQVF